MPGPRLTDLPRELLARIIEESLLPVADLMNAAFRSQVARQYRLRGELSRTCKALTAAARLVEHERLYIDESKHAHRLLMPAVIDRPLGDTLRVLGVVLFNGTDAVTKSPDLMLLLDSGLAKLERLSLYFSNKSSLGPADFFGQTLDRIAESPLIPKLKHLTIAGHIHHDDPEPSRIDLYAIQQLVFRATSVESVDIAHSVIELYRKPMPSTVARPTECPNLTSVGVWSCDLLYAIFGTAESHAKDLRIQLGLFPPTDIAPYALLRASCTHLQVIKFYSEGTLPPEPWPRLRILDIWEFVEPDLPVLRANMALMTGLEEVRYRGKVLAAASDGGQHGVAVEYTFDGFLSALGALPSTVRCLRLVAITRLGDDERRALSRWGREHGEGTKIFLADRRELVDESPAAIVTDLPSVAVVSSAQVEATGNDGEP